MRVDSVALVSFARAGLKMFWFRQVMFLGATAITTAYLSSPAPVFCYLVCLVAELGEVYWDRRVLAAEDLTEQQIDWMVGWHTLVAACSAAAVSAFGIIVASLGEQQFLFVPLIYMFAAALYATMFNHQVKPVLVARLAIYVAGFLILAGAEIITSKPDERFLAFIQFFTVASASFFFVMNAVEFRKSYCERRERDREASLREERLLLEMEERKIAEIAQENSELRFKSLFENAPIPIREEDLSGMKRMVDELNLTDPDEFQAYLDAHPKFLEYCARQIIVVDANRASLEQHGYAEKADMLARVVRELSPAAMQIVRKTLTAIHEGARDRSYETTITRVDGEVRTVAATWSVVPGHEETYARILLCSVDLTDRLASEAALRQAQKMEAVGQLTGGVAHDFNNLLTVISGNMELLETTGGIDPDLSQPIMKAVRRGAELTQRLLAFSRKQPLAAQPIDLQDLVAGMTGLLRRSLGEEIAIEIELPDQLWCVHADPGQVEAALLNLALNSRDAMPAGGTLRIDCRNMSVGTENDHDLDAGDYVALSVSDTGTGMTPDVINRAFEPFFTTKEVGKGSGLGLSMAYGFAKQSSGGLHIESVPGRGATVSLYLPRSAAEQLEDARPKGADIKVAGQGERILILEDDRDVRAYLTRLMESFGYKALPAQDVMAAREILGRTEKIDLLISDIMLSGGLRGPDFAVEMLAYFPGTPVIFVSGRPSEIESAKTHRIRNAVVIAKPFTRDEILKKILEALGDRP